MSKPESVDWLDVVHDELHVMWEVVEEVHEFELPPTDAVIVHKKRIGRIGVHARWSPQP